MSGKSSQPTRSEYLTKILLILVYLGGFAVVLFIGNTLAPGWDAFNINALELVLLSLATFRMGRLIAYDHVTEPLRAYFTRTVPDKSGAGLTVIATGSGVRRAFGQLLSCPICVGTWVAALLVYLLYFFPGPTRVFLIFTAVIGAAELIHNTTEALCWSGVLSRVRSGEMIRQQQAEKNSELE